MRTFHDDPLLSNLMAKSADDEAMRRFEARQADVHPCASDSETGDHHPTPSATIETSATQLASIKQH